MLLIDLAVLASRRTASLHCAEAIARRVYQRAEVARDYTFADRWAPRRLRTAAVIVVALLAGCASTVVAGTTPARHSRTIPRRYVWHE